MLKRVVAVLGLVVLPLILTGADAVQPKPSAKKESPSDILVRVNGEEITRGQLERHIDMMLALLRNKRKRPLAPNMVAKFRREKRKPLSDEMFRRLVLRTNLAHSNITVTAQAKAAVERECLRSFGKRKQTLDELKAYVAKAGFGKEFTANLEFDMRMRTFLMTVCSNDYFVTQERLDKVRAGLEAYNKKATATNEQVRVHAAGILKRAKAGEDFGKLADEYNQDPDPERKPHGDLGDCDASDFPEEKHIWRMLSSLPAGGVSDLMETEDGYAIFKVVRRNTAEQSQTGDASLTLARIFFRRAFLFPEQTDAELRVDVEREQRAKLMADVYKRFRAQSEVSYPNGPVRAQ